eukprot:scaffold2798_cov70-Phaeocystis_antarctica.AAC.5
MIRPTRRATRGDPKRGLLFDPIAAHDGGAFRVKKDRKRRLIPVNATARKTYTGPTCKTQMLHIARGRASRHGHRIPDPPPVHTNRGAAPKT